jgi:hypothetical protein
MAKQAVNLCGGRVITNDLLADKSKESIWYEMAKIWNPSAGIEKLTKVSKLMFQCFRENTDTFNEEVHLELERIYDAGENDREVINSSELIPPQSFHLTFSRTEWDYMDIFGKQNLETGWTNEIYEKFKTKNPRCVLIFKTNHMKKPGSKKKQSPLWYSWAVCKFSSCGKYKFTVNSMPDDDTANISMTCTRYGDFKHLPGESHKRPLTSKQRSEVKKELAVKAPSKVAKELRDRADDCIVAMGNLCGVHPNHVLKVAKSEINKDSRLSPDPWIALIATATQLDLKYGQNTLGVLSMKPFMVTCHTPQQFKFYKSQKGVSKQ